MEAVIVEFAVGEDRVQQCIEALEKLTESLVAKQPQFHGNTILVEHETGTVANMMLWDKAGDFVAFRDANRSTIGPAIGHFNPKPRFFEVAGDSNAP